jgi:hypothetical protein
MRGMRLLFVAVAVEVTRTWGGRDAALRRYRSVFFGCVPFTSTLAPANLAPS